MAIMTGRQIFSGALLLAAFCLQPRDVSGADPKAQEIVAKAIDAAGGMKAWENVRDAVLRETQVRYTDQGEVKSEATHYVKRRGNVIQYRVESQTPEGKTVMVWDGKEYWATRDGKPDEKLMEDARRIAYNVERFSLPFYLAEPGGDLQYEGQEDVQGVQAHKVKLTKKGHHHPEIYYYSFHPRDFRILQIYFSHHGDETFETLSMSDYQVRSGLKKERKRDLIGPEGKRIYLSEFKEIQYNVGVADSLFQKPSR